jgi:hypothetical protein
VYAELGHFDLEFTALVGVVHRPSRREPQQSAWSTTMSTCSISVHGPDTLLLGRWAIRLTRTCSADTGQTADPSTALVQYVTTACDNSSSRRNNDLLAEHLLVVGGMIDIA